MFSCFHTQAAVCTSAPKPATRAGCPGPKTPASEQDGESAPDKSLRRQIKSQVESGRQKRNESNLRQIFDKYKDSDSNVLRKESVMKACTAANIIVEGESALEDLSGWKEVDLEKGLDFDNFKNIATNPSELEIMMKSIPFHQIFADAVPHKPGYDPLKCFETLTSHEIDIMVEASLDLLKHILKEQSALASAVQCELSKTAAGLRAGISKFTCIKMKAGNISDFHEGLGGRVGALI
jgi:hypothetical protein